MTWLHHGSSLVYSAGYSACLLALQCRKQETMETMETMQTMLCGKCCFLDSNLRIMLLIVDEFLHNTYFYDFNQSATQEFILGGLYRNLFLPQMWP